MPRGPAVPIKGVWLRRSGDHVVVSIEDENGNDLEIIREYYDSNFSHSVSEWGLQATIDGTGKV